MMWSNFILDQPNDFHLQRKRQTVDSKLICPKSVIGFKSCRICHETNLMLFSFYGAMF